MTLGFPAPPATDNADEDRHHPREHRRITRRVSSLVLSLAGVVDEPHEQQKSSVLGDPAASASDRSPNTPLSRQVSNDGLVSISDSENDKEDYGSSSSSSGRTSPIRCVSEFDKAVEACSADGEAHKKSSSQNNHRRYFPSIAIPLQDPTFLQFHTRALRLEAELQPMRLILSRLMNHPTLNRKGIFNVPVDPVAFNLPDYHDVIRHPMDLGLVKVRLHAIVYLSRQAVADDIRLVFRNAMTYNPPNNAVHVAARDLLAFFEDQLQSFAPELCLQTSSTQAPSAVTTTTTTPFSILPETSNPTVHTPPFSTTSIQGTRKSATTSLADPAHLVKKRKKRGSKIDLGHACHSCMGRTCRICCQGCLPLEPTMLLCNGPGCSGARIRKGAIYFVTPDGSRHFCQRCHVGLPAVLPSSHNGGWSSSHGGSGGCVVVEAPHYKRDLLKRKNDEELVEQWLSCTQCEGAVHRMCALHDEYVYPEDDEEADYVCPECAVSESSPTPPGDAADEVGNDLYTFVSGSEIPLRLSEVTGTAGSGAFSAENLPETEVSAFMERRVRERMNCDQYPHAERTLLVRVISDCDRCFKVPDVVRNHFRMASQDSDSSDSCVAPPSAVTYRSKAIALFQKIDGLDVCIFCMYVHEYNGWDCCRDDPRSPAAAVMDQKKRVYIAYLDSVEHFRPRTSRTSVYHEMLVSYLATARKRGFETAHIWSCPPSRGNCFVFWNHPCSQRTPNPERLEAWYHAALSRAVECGVVTDIQSLYETDFQQQLEVPESSSSAQRRGYLLCPPLLDGDFWIEEAVRVHALNMTRQLRSKVEECEAVPPSVPGSGYSDRCPARQVAAVLRDVILPHQSSLPFRRPVNAAAMKLADYHKVITNPMDLGTVYSRCVLGEYPTLADLVSDVELVVSNAKTYNPKGHIVHVKADEVRDLFFSELNRLVGTWLKPYQPDESLSWETVASISLSLDLVFEGSPEPIEDVDSSKFRSAQLRLKFDESLLDSEDREMEESRASDKPGETPWIGGGPESIYQRMVGKDTWLLEKNPVPAKGVISTKKSNCRRRKGLGDVEGEPPAKRRRQAWLGIEVGAAVRRMRTSFFSCSLAPKPETQLEDQRASQCFESYSFDFDPSICDGESCASTVADVRHSLLELSQFRNLEFDTLRHAKYSTAVLLYHFHNCDAAGAIPVCASCKEEIQGVRWHKQAKVVDIGRRNPQAPSASASFPEELCSDCFNSMDRCNEHFIPLQVSMLGSSKAEPGNSVTKSG